MAPWYLLSAALKPVMSAANSSASASMAGLRTLGVGRKVRSPTRNDWRACREAKESAALAKATISKTTQRLADKVAQMEALTAKYQQDMAGLWEQYNEEYAALENAVMQIRMACEQKKQGVKRRIAALAQENEAALAEARKRAEAVKGRAVKMPQLAKLLQSLL